MILLLDTHTVLWFWWNDPHLSASAIAMICDPNNRKLVSPATAWEVAISLRTLSFIAILSSSISPALAQTTNDKVVKFCKEQLGKKVGEGECVHLVEAALQSAGAKPRTTFKEYPNKADYVWGELVYALEIKDNSQKEMKVPKKSIQPGDVIQFRDARFEGKNLRGFDSYHATYPHHAAIVLAVKEDGVFTALEQNINGKKIVRESTYRLIDLKTGWIRIYRPAPE